MLEEAEAPPTSAGLSMLLKALTLSDLCQTNSLISHRRTHQKFNQPHHLGPGNAENAPATDNFQDFTPSLWDHRAGQSGNVQSLSLHVGEKSDLCES